MKRENPIEFEAREPRRSVIGSRKDRATHRVEYLKTLATPRPPPRAYQSSATKAYEVTTPPEGIGCSNRFFGMQSTRRVGGAGLADDITPLDQLMQPFHLLKPRRLKWGLPATRPGSEQKSDALTSRNARVPLDRRR